MLPIATVALAGDTVTEAAVTGGGGGGAGTVMSALALLPSTVAVIVADPVATPLTSPLALTVATPVALLDQAMVRPVSAFPAESFGVAVS